MSHFLSQMKALMLVVGVPVALVFVYSAYFQTRPNDRIAAMRRGGPDPLAFVAKGDAKIADARAKAKATLPDFLRHLENPDSDESHFGVKFRLTPANVAAGTPPADDGGDEFIWANRLKLTEDGRALTGNLDDTPRKSGFFNGQAVIIPTEEVTDWGYMKAGVMQGHYTTKILLDQLTPEEASRAKRVMGWE